MNATAEALRRALSDGRPSWCAAGYPPELRARSAAWLSSQRAQGTPWRTLAEALGVSVATARRWGAAPAEPSGWVPLLVRPEAAEPPFAPTRWSTCTHQQK